MSKKMDNAPVYFTVAQVRFNPVLNLEAYLRTIQDRMRKSLFPDFRREDYKQLIVPFGASDGGQMPSPSFVPLARYIFGNTSGTSGFILESSSLALQTSAYETFEKFSETLMAGLGIVHEALQLDFTDRIGLRYLDAVQPRPGESLSDYLAPEVLGLSVKLASKLAHSFSETVSTNAAGNLISRVIIQDGGLRLPSDIAALAPKLAARFAQHNGRHAIIDTDGYYDVREAFGMEKLGSRLIALHDEVIGSFNATVTPHALGVWA